MQAEDEVRGRPEREKARLTLDETTAHCGEALCEEKMDATKLDQTTAHCEAKKDETRRRRIGRGDGALDETTARCAEKMCHLEPPPIVKTTAHWEEEIRDLEHELDQTRTVCGSSPPTPLLNL